MAYKKILVLTNTKYPSIILLLHFFRGEGMVVDISKITKLYGASVNVDFSEEINGLDVSGQKISFDGPIDIKGKITNLGELFLFEGTIKGKISAECDRCTKDVLYSFEIEASEKFSQNNIENEDDLYVFKGDVIDLSEAVKNVIVLNLPMKYLCSEECKGLCPICGADWNITKCGCKNENIDPRLEGLKNFFK